MNSPNEALTNPARVSIPFFGVEVTPLTATEVVDYLLERVNRKSGALIGNLNLHGVYIFHTDPVFKEFCSQSDLVLIDGAPVAWAGRIPSRYRIGSTDWLDALLPRAEGLTILAIGGSKESSEGARDAIVARFPAVNWIPRDGFGGQTVDEDLERLIQSADLVLVGMGMPVQESWILDNSYLLKGKVIANVGGCFDYYAGTQSLAPRWMGKLGLEWVYRLFKDPKRLWRRYLVEPVKLLVVLLRRPRRR